MYPITSCFYRFQLPQTTPCECFLCCPLPLFSSTFVYFPQPVNAARVSRCAPLFIFRAVTRPPHSSYMRLVRRLQARGLVRCCCCSSLCRRSGEGGGHYKNPLPQPRSFTLEEESKHGGLVDVAPRDPPNPPLYLPTTTTGVFLSPQHCTVLPKNLLLPRQINAKRNNARANR